MLGSPHSTAVLDEALNGTDGYAPPARDDLLRAAAGQPVLAAVALPSVAADDDGLRTDLVVAAVTVDALLVWEGAASESEPGTYVASTVVVPRRRVSGIDVHTVRQTHGRGQVTDVSVVVHTAASSGASLHFEGFLHNDGDPEDGEQHLVGNGMLISDDHMLTADLAGGGSRVVAALRDFADYLSGWVAAP